jgi:hypothetical protein
MIRKTIWGIAIATAALLIVVMWPNRHSSVSGSLAIQFVGYTNYQGQHVAIFDLVNRYDVPVYFLVAIERKILSGWPTYGPGSPMPHTAPTRIEQDPKLEPGEVYRLLAIVPTGSDFSAWRVSIGYIPVQPITSLDRKRQAASDMTRAVPVLSDTLNPNRGIIALGPEMSP